MSNKTKFKNKIKVDDYGKVKIYSNEELKGLKFLIRLIYDGCNHGICINSGSC